MLPGSAVARQSTVGGPAHPTPGCYNGHQRCPYGPTRRAGSTRRRGASRAQGGRVNGHRSGKAIMNPACHPRPRGHHRAGDLPGRRQVMQHGVRRTRCIDRPYSTSPTPPSRTEPLPFRRLVERRPSINAASPSHHLRIGLPRVLSKPVNRLRSATTACAGRRLEEEDASPPGSEATSARYRRHLGTTPSRRRNPDSS